MSDWEAVGWWALIALPAALFWSIVWYGLWSFCRDWKRSR